MEAEFRRLVATGQSYGNIAIEMSALYGRPISRNGAVGKAHRLGLVQPPVKPLPPPPPPPQPPRKGSLRQRFPRCCTIMGLTDRRCHWPLSETGIVDFYYCGAAVKDGPYCPEHRRIAYHRDR